MTATDGKKIIKTKKSQERGKSAEKQTSKHFTFWNSCWGDWECFDVEEGKIKTVIVVVAFASCVIGVIDA